MSDNDKNTKLSRELEFHDDWADQIDEKAIDVRTCFEGATCPENRFIVGRLGELKNRRVLDLGCGGGEAAVYFALQGAVCTGTDFSPGMLGATRRLAAKYGVEVATKQMDAEEITYPDESFDVVYAANLLHHVDPEKAIREAYRVLAPGGKFAFWDPLKHNPVINVYRRIASGVRTVDEHPLHISIVRDVHDVFGKTVYDTFWLFSLWVFLRFYLIERVNPNEERYWKKIVYEEERLRDMYFRLERLDRAAKRVPFLRRYAWNIAVVAEKPQR